ncbi:N-acetylmuramoyl-L-alanine amidase family protein [Listeria newyorkensis]|uniref:peptidoglycan recognition protein family protein n=1 Tax=Listeria newyorkensis TaxID=1497681 RepID=UPI001552B4BA|nr:N-acetylmuramoyl-L-alanine amidase [Listeria newyorkensis]
MKKVMMGLMVVLMIFAVALPTQAAVNIQKQHINGLPKTAYANGVGKPSMIVLHETANNSATIENEVSYMSRNWQNAFVHAFASDGKVIEIADTNYTAWGAGSVANRYAIHVELVRKGNFTKAYGNWLDAAVYYAKQYNIPMTFNTGKKGFVTHAWVSDQLGGTNHQDPIAWLKQNGVSMTQLEKDLKAKYRGDTIVSPSTPPVTETPKPNVPSNIVVGAKVKVLPSAKKYATGQAIPAFIKGSQYTILQTKADRVRLSGINSWMYNRDVEVMKTTVVPPVTSKKVYLPATASTWRIYGLRVSPVKVNTKAFLKPAKFGGLSYTILKSRGSDVYEIQTSQFGRVQIYASPATGATIK